MPTGIPWRDRRCWHFNLLRIDTRLQWFDMSGNPTGTTGQVAYYLSPKISPDGKQMLFF